ncbi:unnamed protein product [Cylindrotheca closterium]|uniref:SSD domain-containing protein n=1 Tax=Cylindrotheca closterium TaxID=2856 RepID=A0AAD2GDC0_9STRA|nr:unnamed protein product [Cylindrotheca closterium]
MPKKDETDRPSKRLSAEPEGFRGSQIDSESESDEETPPPKRTSKLSITRLSLSKSAMGESGSVAPKRVSGASNKDVKRISHSTAPTVVNDGFWERQSMRIARIPRIFLSTTLLVSVILSVVGFTVGGFDANVDNAGWQSRGTDIANKQTQLLLVSRFKDELFAEGEPRWRDLLSNVQPGWQTESLGDDGTDDGLSRRLKSIESEESQWYLETSHRDLQATLDLDVADLGQRLIAGLPNCNIGWYANITDLLYEEHLWPIWKTENPSTTLLSPNMIKDICVAEENTQRVLEANNFCFGCQEGCLPPYSPVLFARIVVENGFSMTCQQLSEGWTQYQAATENSWAACTKDLKEVYDKDGFTMPTSCPPGFTAALVEENFDSTKFMTYTSSIFATNADPKVMYDFVDQFDQGVEDVVYGAYDTQYEGFNKIFTDSVVGRDMALACASAFITAIAILVHTKSPFITGIGLLQIILSFPLSFFVYTLLGGLDFFPFLNFIGVFVVFALGADDIFVAVDKWKNARIENPDADTEIIAAIAFPDAAGAMFLTTITTAIAFFGTAICPVAPIKMFAIFCGLLIMFDYLMCCMLVFPALCIYDSKLRADKSNCCNACNCGKKEEGEDSLEDENKMSLIHRILFGYYNILHKFRWGLMALSLIGFALACWGATTLKLPTSAEVRLVGEDAIQFEENFLWRDNLLQSSLDKSGGSTILVAFGIEPADTGDQNNPKKWSQLVLDNTFDAAPEASQRFLESFCPEAFAEEFLAPASVDYECPINRFAAWLQTESAKESPDAGYASKCGGASGIPVPEANFDACLMEWAAQNEEDTVLSVDNKVRIIMMEFAIRIRFDSPFDDLENEYNTIDGWMTAKSATAPETANKVIFSSQTFWWFDTNRQMLTTATGSASIALATAAIVIFLSSYSFSLTFFATFTIGYVLTSVTSTLVALGWTLGFLESICFAILIGVSVDFVIHFCHAYSHAHGDVDRHERTQQALIRMGPSILAAGVTTIAAAIIMLFTVINFFQKFALILFMTIIQATVGSFIVFLTLTDCVGPSNPTYMADLIKAKLGFGGSEDDSVTPKKKRDGTELTTESSR